MTVTIKGKEITLKYSLRAMMMYENITESSFNPNGITDVLTYMYCVVVSSSKDYSITFEEFIDSIDEQPNIMVEFTKWLTDVVNTQNLVKKN